MCTYLLGEFMIFFIVWPILTIVIGVIAISMDDNLRFDEPLSYILGSFIGCLVGGIISCVILLIVIIECQPKTEEKWDEVIKPGAPRSAARPPLITVRLKYAVYTIPQTVRV